MRVHHHHRARDLGDLPQPVLAGLALERLDIDDVAGAEHLIDVAAGPLHAVGRDAADLALAGDLARSLARRLQPDPRLSGRDLEHDREPPGLDVAERRHFGERQTPFAPDELELLLPAAPAAVLVVADEAVDERLAGHRLHLRIEGGAHRQAALVELLLAVALGDLAPDLLGEVARGDGVRGDHPRADGERLLLRLVGLIALDVAVIDHAIEHPVPALERRLLLA